ncbi:MULTISPECIES: biotin synthase auxiliary protein BsaP [unclassified Corynebacterium]|uniref:biotin synthase auxiliary protein BsaP n=1 Tax=unclassified Corynebacterium TaxID=2624378 RepID=UPI00309514F7
MKTANTDLLQAIVVQDEPIYDPFTGAHLAAGEFKQRSHSARAGLEAPRYCQLCGRRMVVQVRPDGWTAKCSRHGEVDSEMLERR